MSTTKDPLADQPAPDRVFYATGVMLDAQDFLAEQNYHRGRLARALAALNGYGTAAGLEVSYSLKAGQPGSGEAQVELINVNPGVAIDRLGRLIEVPRAACIRLNRWFDGFAMSTDTQVAGQLIKAFRKGPLPIQGLEIDTLDVAGEAHPGDTFNGVVVADVFLHFQSCERGKTPAFASGPFDALDAVQPSRVRDAYHLSLVLRSEGDLAVIRPVDPWSALCDPNLNTAEVLRKLYANARAAILDSWPVGPDPAPTPPEYPADMDDTSGVLLARVAIKARQAGDGAVPQRPALLPDQVASACIDNYLRPFLMTPQAFGLAAVRKIA
jgi:hypothetical protein